MYDFVSSNNILETDKDWIDMQMKAVISFETQLSTYSTACCHN